MYKELLEEAGGNKKLEERITENDNKITGLKKTLKNKNDVLSCTKRRIENFEFVFSKFFFFFLNFILLANNRGNAKREIRGLASKIERGFR